MTILSKGFMCILRHYTWEDVNKCLIILNRDLMTDFKDTIKVQLGEQQWVLLGLITGMWMRRYIQKDKQQKNSWFIKVYPSICGSSQKLETGTLESSAVRERPSYSLFSCLGIFQTSLLVSPSFFCFFQVSGHVWESY